MKVKRDFRIKAKPDMLPLIDVVFLLLVFFIYAMLSMSYHNGIRLELPESIQAKHMPERIELVVSVERDGSVYLGKEAIPLKDLGSRVEGWFHEEEAKATGEIKREVILSGHKELAYQDLFRVMDLLKEVGISNISLQAEAVAK